MGSIAQLDKTLDTAMNDGYGTITIRVVVLEKSMAAAPAPRLTDDSPVDAVPDEVLPETPRGAVNAVYSSLTARDNMPGTISLSCATWISSTCVTA
jgi:hypothetical protein